MYQLVLENINRSLSKALVNLLKEKNIGDKPELCGKISIESNKNFAFGDFSSNVSLQLAKILKTNPKKLAGEITALVKQNGLLKNTCQKVETAGPGFINFYLSAETIQKLLREILDKKEAYARLNTGRDKKIIIEFVSANPTGPLTIAHARQAAVGDTLANILEQAGYQVLREYYLNDRGKQIEILGNSVYLRYLETAGIKTEFPEDHYQGEYIKDIAQALFSEYGEKYKQKSAENIQFFAEYAKDVILAGIKKDLQDFSVNFNSWLSEARFVQGKEIDEVLDYLAEKKHTYTEDKALWFKSSSFGDDKDRVLIRSNGEKTYITPDIAYHRNKFKRGYDILIDLLGPDHHGYISRLKAGVEALGYPADNLNIIIVQLATLYKNGKKLSMSTRAGEFITLRDILNEVGKDAGRFFLLARKTDSHLEFDLDLAKEQSPDNPVYYVQYAHARICSIFKKYKEVYKKDINDLDYEKLDFSLLNEEEIHIIKTLSFFNRIIADSAEALEPQRIPQYLIDLVSLFHSYYNKNKVVSDSQELTALRLAIILGVKTIIKNGLKLLGISAPETM